MEPRRAGAEPGEARQSGAGVPVSVWQAAESAAGSRSPRSSSLFPPQLSLARLPLTRSPGMAAPRPSLRRRRLLLLLPAACPSPSATAAAAAPAAAAAASPPPPLLPLLLLLASGPGPSAARGEPVGGAGSSGGGGGGGGPGGAASPCREKTVTVSTLPVLRESDIAWSGGGGGSPPGSSSAAAVAAAAASAAAAAPGSVPGDSRLLLFVRSELPGRVAVQDDLDNTELPFFTLGEERSGTGGGGETGMRSMKQVGERRERSKVNESFFFFLSSPLGVPLQFALGKGALPQFGKGGISAFPALLGEGRLVGIPGAQFYSGEATKVDAPASTPGGGLERCSWVTWGRGD